MIKSMTGFASLTHEDERATVGVPIRAVVAEGADRNRLWDAHAAIHEQFAAYPSKTTRIIPVARLTPITG